MIIRRATQVVAWFTMPRSATPWRPRASPEGPCGAGIGQRRGCRGRAYGSWDARIPLRGRIFLWKKLLRPTRSRPILPHPGWDGALQVVCLVRLLAKTRPRALHEGPAKRDRAAVGMRRPRL